MDLALRVDDSLRWPCALLECSTGIAQRRPTKLLLLNLPEVRAMTQPETEDQFSDTDVPKDFNVLSWASTIPLCDDLWLQMQAQNIAVVDIAIIREMELQALRVHAQEERTLLELLMALSALSQMWVFSLYEFLRTWRRRAQQIMEIADQYARTKPEKKKKYLAQVISDAKGKEKNIGVALSFHAEHLSRISDMSFVNAVRTYHDKTTGLFQAVEALRVTLAKHEVPKSKRQMAEAPGYARMDIFTGSLYWHFIGEHGELEKVDRRELSNSFLQINPPNFDD
jgi:hypothetical protein